MALDPQKAKEIIRQQLRGYLQGVVDRAVDEMKALCPVRTGRLRAGIEGYLEDGGQDDLTMVFRDDVEYAPHVEYGTRFMDAQPFMRPVLYRMERDLPRDFNGTTFSLG